MHNKTHAFSLVEIIIALAIIILLAVIGLSSKQGYQDNIDNTKIISDIKTINNALESYAQENNSLPMPGGNTNFFTIDTSYIHSYEDTETFGVYGSITEDTLPKKYLDVLPLDPRNNNYYSYGKTKGTEKIVANQFELASVQNINGEYQAYITGNYTAEAGPYNLIREYNGSSFVYDKSKTNLPYNPEELILIATADGVVYREGDTIEATSGDLEIYFSDGSVSVLENGGKLELTKLSFPKENNLNTLVKLSLGAGTIWTKATHLNNESQFEVYTTDSTAAVRGTIFGVRKDGATEVIVIEGEVEVYKNDDGNSTIIDLKTGESTRIVDGYINGIPNLRESDYDNIENNFTVKEDIRGTETVAMINQEIADAIPCAFIVDGDEMCDVELSGMDLFAYAPLNTNTDMFIEDLTTITTSHFGITFDGLGVTVPVSLSNYLTYSGLNLTATGSFAIEMKVNIPTSGNHYLVSDTNLNIFVELDGSDMKLKYNDGLSTFIYSSNLNAGDFNTVYLKKVSNEVWIKANTGAWENTGKIISGNISELLIGAKEIGGNYYVQINDIIDYVKIYKE